MSGPIFVQPLSGYLKHSLYLLCVKIIEWSLLFLIAVVPLIINPQAFDYWYRPKITATYALLMVAGIAWLVKALVRDGSFLYKSSPLTVPLLCYAGAATISTLLSINFKRSFYGDPLRMEGLPTIVTYIALVFLFINQVESKELSKKLFIGLIVSATLVSLYGLLQYFGYNPTEHLFYKHWRRGYGVGSTIGNPNFLGKYLVLIVPIIFSLCVDHYSSKISILLKIALCICFAALITTFTRASWLSVVVSLAFLLWVGFKTALLRGRGKRLMVLTTMICLVGLFFNLYSQERNGQKVAGGQRTVGKVVERSISAFDIKRGEGVATRLYAWKRALLLIRERPYFGYGPETLEIVFKKFTMEYIKRFQELVSIDRAHNNYIDTAFTLGVVGLGAYLAIIVSFLSYLSTLLRRSGNKSHKLLYLGILAGFCGYLINDLFIFSVVSVSPTFWSLMGLTVAVGRINSTVDSR